MSQSATVHTIPVPAKFEDWVRDLKARPTVYDKIEELLPVLVADPKFWSLISAFTDSAAVEGSLVADDYAAAGMIHALASKRGAPLAAEKLHTIKLGLGVVLARFKLSRKYRREAQED
jgi:hypothetical protein